MQIFAVIDTNVIVSALITKNPLSPPYMVLREVLDGKIIPLYHPEIIEEYIEVLSRSKFHLNAETIQTVINSIISNGIKVDPKPTGEIFVDMDDLIFYEIAMEKRDDDAYIVTGNKKHYPVREFIVTPSEMLNILNEMV
ncbi:MAG: putative toxin-antitoxin system toxin component, PIN family [Oscillospiraceae bacterium]